MSEIAPETAQDSQGKGLRDSLPSVQGYTLLIPHLLGTKAQPSSSPKPSSSVPVWGPPLERPQRSLPATVKGSALPPGSALSPAPVGPEAMWKALEETQLAVDVVASSVQLTFLLSTAQPGGQEFACEKSRWIFSLGKRMPQ